MREFNRDEDRKKLEQEVRTIRKVASMMAEDGATADQAMISARSLHRAAVRAGDDAIAALMKEDIEKLQDPDFVSSAAQECEKRREFLTHLAYIVFQAGSILRAEEDIFDSNVLVEDRVLEFEIFQHIPSMDPNDPVQNSIARKERTQELSLIRLGIIKGMGIAWEMDQRRMGRRVRPLDWLVDFDGFEGEI